MKSLALQFIRDDDGQDLIEYGLLLGIITIVVLVSIREIGPKIGTYFSTLNAELT
jgi:pilus assembly protein Flp/PilA